MVTLSDAMGVSPPSLKEIKHVMLALDQNQDGKLSFEEVKPILVQVLEGLVNQAKEAEQAVEDEVEMDKL